MQSGELIVSGKDKVVITLHGFPSKVSVRFTDDCALIPCSPKHADMVEWETETHYKDCGRNKHSCVKLAIKWNVNGVRTIQWNVFY